MKAISRSLLFFLAIFLLAAGSLAPGLAATPTPRRTPTPTSAMPTFILWTMTPTPRPTPRRTPLTTDLRRQLNFFLGGGGGYSWAQECEEALAGYSGPLPAILAGRRTVANYQIGAICLAGLNIKNTLSVTLRSGADRKILSQASFVPGKGEIDDAGRFGFSITQVEPPRKSIGGQFVELDGVSLAALYVWLPPDAVPGPWQVEVRSGGVSIRGSVQFTWPNDRPALYVPAVRYDPFVPPVEVYTATDGNHTALYHRKPGETLKLAGVNLPANASLPLVWYIFAQGHGVLYRSALVRSDAQGRLATSLQIAATETPALFHLTVVLDPAATHARDAGPFLGMVAETCPGAPLSGLLLGDSVYLTPGTDLKTNSLRSQPGLKSSKIGEFSIGQDAVILDGPRCADQIVWWRVRTSASLEGWTAEGQGKSIFLTPFR